MRAAAALLILLAPFGEGGRSPGILLMLQMLVLLFALPAATGRLRSRPGPDSIDGAPVRLAGRLVALFLLLAVAAGLRAAYPFATWQALLDVGCAAALFLAALAAPVSGGDLAWLRGATVLSSTLQALLAIERWVGHGAKEAGRGFLNPNHLAAFLALGALLCVAAAEESWRIPGGRRRAALAGAGALLHVMAAVPLASRGGFLGLGAGLLALGALRWRRWDGRTRRLAVVGGIALAVLAAVVLTLRFERGWDPHAFRRLSIWRASLVMLFERPLLGFGPGLFRYEAPRYNFPLDGPIRYERQFASAHDALLTTAVETGLPAAIAIGAAFALTITALLRGAGPRRDLLQAIGGALLALGTQALFDDLQERPALTFTAALLAGCACAALRRRPAAAEAPGRLRAVAALAAAAALFWGAMLLPYLAHRDALAARQAGSAGLSLMGRAARRNALHPEYRHDLAMAAINSGPPDPDRYAEATIDLLEARRLKPIDPRFPLLLGRVEARAGGALFVDQGAAERAIGFYREAVRLAPLDARLRLELGRALAELGRLQEALEVVREVVRLEPSFLRAGLEEASILSRIGRAAEARQALARVASRRAALAGFRPETAYAREIIADAPDLRARLEAELSGGPRDAGAPPAQGGGEQGALAPQPPQDAGRGQGEQAGGQQIAPEDERQIP
jgi:tetratricopeptide (TPR) repeat protein